MAVNNIQKAYYAKKAIKEKGIEVVFEGPSFNEFVIKLPASYQEINQSLFEKEIIGGFDLGTVYPQLKDHMLVAVTELRTKEEIDALAHELGDQHE